jgi:multidrug efflux pump subunit AcrA (membrane-fusion protein)
MASWDQRRAQHLSREAQLALRRLQSQSHTASDGLSARLEVLMAEKRVAYQSRNMERYEAAIKAIVRQAQPVCSQNHAKR